MCLFITFSLSSAQGVENRIRVVLIEDWLQETHRKSTSQGCQTSACCHPLPE